MSKTIDAPDRAQIRRLNDRLRCHGVGNGTLFMTEGITSAPDGFAKRAIAAMRTFDTFTKDNDPHEEHDFGAFDLEGQRLLFKIDYYGPDMQRGSDDSSDEAQTYRVLTLMLAHEY